MFCGGEGNIVIDNGYKYDCFTGVLIGPYLEPDKYNTHSAPLFVYNRTDRFYLLCLRSIPGPQADVNRCVKMFQSIENVWIVRKAMYLPRKYFLSQKLLCKMICKHLEIKCTITRAIQDRNRLLAQLVIYTDLLCNIKCPHDCISENKQNNINSGLLRNFLLPAARLRHTPSEIPDRMMTGKLQWRFSSG